MRITIIQTTICWEDKAANLTRTHGQLKQLAGTTDLVVLPEMFTTGFCTSNLQLAEDMEGHTIVSLQQWACNYGFAIVGSFIAIENDKHYNRAFFVTPHGQVHYADKRHLFSLGKEDAFFSAGQKRLIVPYMGFNICLLVCYDVRFPVWSRNVDNVYDLLIYVANFPQRRIADWDILLRARAIENQAYVCGVNRVGVDGLNISYSGHSVLLDFRATELITFTEGEAGIRTCDISYQPLQKYRQGFAVWQDADSFSL